MQNATNAALAPAWFIWQVPGKPLSVQLSLNVVEQLGAAVVAGFKSIPKRGLEVGGLLLGDTEVHDGATVVSIHDFEPFPCEHRLGPSYILMDSEQDKLGEAALPKGKEGDLRVAGYYRSQTRTGFAMSTEDLATMARFFSDPAQLFLLIQPSANGRMTAGFYIWENGAIHGEAMYLAFPFHNSDLRGRFTIVEERAAQQPLPPETPRLRKLASRRVMEGLVEEQQRALSHRVAPGAGMRTQRLFIGIAVVLMLAVVALLLQRSTRSSIQGPSSLGLHVALEDDGF